MIAYETAVQEEIARQQAAYNALPDDEKQFNQPPDEASIRAMLSFLQQPEMSDIPATPDLSVAVYKVGDKYYSVANQAWTSATPDAITLPTPTEQYLKETLQFYKLPVAVFLLSNEEKFAKLREERDRRLAEHDVKVSQALREQRVNPDNPSYAAIIAAWDTYAQALCDLPDQPGAPWDGGGSETPWPVFTPPASVTI